MALPPALGTENGPTRLASWRVWRQSPRRVSVWASVTFQSRRARAPAFVLPRSVGIPAPSGDRPAPRSAERKRVTESWLAPRRSSVAASAPTSDWSGSSRSRSWPEPKRNSLSRTSGPPRPPLSCRWVYPSP
ncbi:MAG: hypothetical protein ACJ79S_01440 [Gemmatimonadaceae bacterium]